MATRRTTFDGKTTDIYSSALDPTNQPQAATQQDVAGQDYATRLWQSLNYTYGQQRDQSNKQYDQAIGATDRAALQRGMGRSSYTTQTLANLGQQKVDAWNNIYSAQVADYQNRLNDEENSDRQLAASYLNAIISAGGTPSDDLLRRAGISRSDAMAMIQQPKSSGGGSYNPKPNPGDGDEDKGDGTENPGPVDSSTTVFNNDLFKLLGGLGNTTPAAAKPKSTAGRNAFDNYFDWNKNNQRQQLGANRGTTVKQRK